MSGYCPSERHYDNGYGKCVYCGASVRNHPWTWATELLWGAKVVAATVVLAAVFLAWFFLVGRMSPVAWWESGPPWGEPPA